MKTFKEFLYESKAGTYAAVKPISDHAKQLSQFLKDSKVPNAEPIDKLHTTLLYSRKHLPNYKPDDALHHKAEIRKFEVWPTESGKNCLVMKLHSPSLSDRHSELMDDHDAEYDYDQYKPHISLSYDIGDYDHTKLDITKLPKAIHMSHEYYEPLDTSGK